MKLARKTTASLVGAGLAFALSLPGCGGGDTSPTVVVTPTPSPTPTPTPTPAPSPSAQGCRLSAMPECTLPGGGGCCREERGDQLGEFVELSIRDVQAQRPELFDGDAIKRVEDEDLVVQLVARRIEQRFGLCAKPGSPVEDEIAVKNSNSFSEQFDVILSNHRVNVYGYMATCRPARF